MSPSPDDVVDAPETHEVRARMQRYQGSKWSLVSDEVHLHDDVVVTRDVVLHPGAVGVVALDAADSVILVRQYRHPVGAQLWELPAGLLDDAAESALAAAKRELFEEAHLRADHWNLLIDLYSSPGMSSEVIRIFVARGLHEVPVAERHVQTEEERDMPALRIPLERACDLALAGQLHNAAAVAGILAAQRARASDWTPLRPVDTALVRPMTSGPASGR